MARKNFKEDKFLQVALHPSTRTLDLARVDYLFRSLKDDQTNRHTPHNQIPEKSQSAQKSHTLENNSIQTHETEPKQPEEKQKFFYDENDPNDPRYYPESQRDPDAPFAQRPVSQIIRENPEQAEQIKEELGFTPIQLSDTGWKMALETFYKAIFDLAGKKFEKDMTLSEDEASEIVNASMPLIHKYMTQDFMYGAEFAFAIALGTLIYSKFKYSDDNTKKDSGEKKSMEENEDTMFSKMAQHFRAEFEKREAEIPNHIRPLTDLEQQKIKKFCDSVPNGAPYSYKYAQYMVAYCEVMGFQLDFVLQQSGNISNSMWGVLEKEFGNG